MLIEVVQPSLQPIAQSLNSGMASGDPWGRAEGLANLLVELLAHPEPAVKAACLGASEPHFSCFSSL